MPVFHDHDASASAWRGTPTAAESGRSAFSRMPAGEGRAGWLAALPSLGAVLCHVVDRPSRVPLSPPCRLWPAHPWLEALPGTMRVRSRVHLDSDGPCEWLECMDADGVAWMRVVLLPDSDYCAWDRLQQQVPDVGAEIEMRRCAQRNAWLRGLRGGAHGRVAIVQFQLHVWAGQAWLGMDDAAASRLGRERAFDRARQWHLGEPRSCRSGFRMR